MYFLANYMLLRVFRVTVRAHHPTHLNCDHLIYQPIYHPSIFLVYPIYYYQCRPNLLPLRVILHYDYAWNEFVNCKRLLNYSRFF